MWCRRFGDNVAFFRNGLTNRPTDRLRRAWPVTRRFAFLSSDLRTSYVGARNKNTSMKQITIVFDNSNWWKYVVDMFMYISVLHSLVPTTLYFQTVKRRLVNCSSLVMKHINTTNTMTRCSFPPEYVVKATLKIYVNTATTYLIIVPWAWGSRIKLNLWLLRSWLIGQSELDSISMASDSNTIVNYSVHLTFEDYKVCSW